jgi:anti-sigma factor RsiW
VAPPRDQGFPSTEAWRQTADCGPTVTLLSASGGPRASVAAAPGIACVSLLPASPARHSLMQVGPTIFDTKIRIQSNHM